MPVRSIMPVLVVVLCVTIHAAPLTIYVAPDGNDSWSGRLSQANSSETDGPLATIIAARDMIRQLRDTNIELDEVSVSLRGGTYYMDEPFVLLPQDSAVTYAAYPGEKPILSGGRIIGNWKPGPGGKIWSANISDVAEGKWYFQQLFVNGRRCVRARTPNDGYFTIAGGAKPKVDPDTGNAIPRDKTAFDFDAGDIKPWPDLNDVNVVIYHSWETSRLRIATVNETTRTVEFTGPANWRFEQWGSGQRFFVENAPDALDAPGEWLLDRHTGTVSYYPFPGEDLSTAEVIAPRLKILVQFKGNADAGHWVRNINLVGLTFCYEDWVLERGGHSDAQAVHTAPAAIMADAAIECTIEKCEIVHVGDNGIWFRRGCKNNRIVQNRIHDLGIGGVRIGEPFMPPRRPPSEQVTSSGNLIDNNHIFDGGHVYAAGVGVMVAESHHNLISHNEIHDFNYSGISIGWDWGDGENSCHHNVIEYNHVHHVMNGQLNDGGVIYTLGNSPGSIIRNNVFHDAWPYSNIGWGIYLDSRTNQYLVENNVVYNIKNGGLMKNNGGHANTIRNNIFAFSAMEMFWPCFHESDPNHFERNIIYFTQGSLFISGAVGRLNDLVANGQSPGTWDHNVYWNPAQPDFKFFNYDFSQWQANGLDQNSIIADPLFVDADAYDFRLKPGSPALALGFKPIDTSTVGLYGDPEWIAEARQVKHRPTKLPPVPTRQPKPINDGFEQTAINHRPSGASVMGEEKGASIRVTDEQAATGRHSMKITDVSGMAHSYDPHIVYEPHFTEGTARQSFNIMLQPQCVVIVEWRDKRPFTYYPNSVGPSVKFEGNGKVTASGQSLGTVPVGEWVRVEIDCQLGGEASGTYTVTLTARGRSPKRFASLKCTGDQFRELHWLGFLSNAVSDSVLYVDDLKLRQ